jgi:hypothetical protein
MYRCNLFLIADFRFLMDRSATASISKRQTPFEFLQSEIKNQKSEMMPACVVGIGGTRLSKERI